MKRTNKRLVSCLCAAAMLASAMTGFPAGVFEGTNAVISASAETFTGKAGPSATYSYDSETKVLTIGGTGAVVGPEGLFGLYTEYTHSVDSVIIESGITEIGRSTFTGKGITNIILGDTLEMIRDVSFNSNSISSIRIPGSVKIILNGAFDQNNTLESVYIEKPIQLVDSNAFGAYDQNIDFYLYYVPDSNDEIFYNTLPRYASNHSVNLHVPANKLNEYEKIVGNKNYTLYGDLPNTLEEGSFFKNGDQMSFGTVGTYIIDDDSVGYSRKLTGDCELSLDTTEMGRSFIGTWNQHRFYIGSQTVYVNAGYIPNEPLGLKIIGGTGEDDDGLYFSPLYEDPYDTTRTSISGAEVTVSKKTGTVTVELDGTPLNSDDYTVDFYGLNDKGYTDVDNHSVDFPQEEGYYVAVITAKPESGYKGAVASEVFHISPPPEIKTKPAKLDGYYKVGNNISFDFPGTYFRMNDAEGSVVSAQPDYSPVLLEYVSYDSAAKQHKFAFAVTYSGGDVFRNDVCITSENSSTPWGIHITGGSGTQSDPYTFEAVFETPLIEPTYLVTIPAAVEFDSTGKTTANIDIEYVNCDEMAYDQWSTLPFGNKTVKVTIAKINNKSIGSVAGSTNKKYTLVDSGTDHTIDYSLDVVNFDGVHFDPLDDPSSALAKARIDTNSSFYVEDRAVMDFAISSPETAGLGTFEGTLTFRIELVSDTLGLPSYPDPVEEAKRRVPHD